VSGEWSDEARRKRLELRAMLAGKDLIVMPGGFSPVYARMAQEIGFRCFFLAGSQLSGFLLGVPDAGILGLRDIVDHARHVAAHTSIPLLLDAAIPVLATPSTCTIACKKSFAVALQRSTSRTRKRRRNPRPAAAGAASRWTRRPAKSEPR
jgi:hypothetical protein